MDNVFEISRFDDNTLIIGYAKIFDLFTCDQTRGFVQDLEKQLPKMKIVVTPLLDGVYMIKEKT